MIQSKMIEKEEDLHCSLKHKLPILMVAFDKTLKRNEKLLCCQCMENLESKAQLMSFKKVLQIIEENQKLKYQSVENVIMISIKRIEELQQSLVSLKSEIVQQLDQLIRNVDEQKKHIIQTGQQNVTYSFHDELDNLIKEKKFEEFSQKTLLDQIGQLSYSWNQKIDQKLNLFKSFQESQKCQEILKQLSNINQTQEITREILNKAQKDVIQVDNKQKQQVLTMSQSVQLNLIDNQYQQNGWCQAIVFNRDGSIMISTYDSEVKIWNFEKGRFTLSNSYNKHSNPVYCLVYSKKQNSFISGCGSQQIICWKQINQIEWKWSQPFQQHNASVMCLLLNKQEDQLISGGNDHRVIVWQVDFTKNDLKFLYSLDMHSNCVESISFNQSETILASCGYDQFIIWGKGLKGNWEYKYRQNVSSGNKIYFVNDQQFLWVPNAEQMNDIFVFELQNGVFKQNQSKTISLIENNECEDQILFPIMHNKDRNVILVRHKHHIYLIRRLNDGTFNIVASLNSQTTWNYGTMTNNGQYLVFWDMENKTYSSYEIIYK